MAKLTLPPEKIEMLVQQIEKAWQHFQIVRVEAKSILEPGHMPDAELQLNDVLQATEEATARILEQATAIGMAVQAAGGSQELQDEIQNRVMAIYEACSFQDLTGQRIKKVLKHINQIGDQLKRLTDIAHLRTDKPPAPAKDPLLNGPQLIKDTPSQNDIDSLFQNT